MFTRHVEKSLTVYCDGELSAADRQRVDAHLATCARCRTALDAIRFSAAAVRELGAVSAPPAVWQGIEAALDEPRSEGIRVGALQWAAACGVLAYRLYRRSRPAAPSAETH